MVVAEARNHPGYLEGSAVGLLENDDLMLGKKPPEKSNTDGAPGEVFVQNCAAVVRDHADAAHAARQDAHLGHIKDAAPSKWSCRRWRC